jgi:dsDNA-specific endonuclease/ATPase MutS2
MLRDRAYVGQTALVFSQWIHNVRLTAVEQQEEPVRIPITDVFDLHSVPPRDVEPIVEEYLEEARRLGLKALRIIHGRGIGVQREIVRSILARTTFVESFGDAPAEAGGWGATLVTLQ